jgi:hypothetical protein
MSNSQRHINARKNQHHSAFDMLRNQESEWENCRPGGKKERNKIKSSKYVTPPNNPNSIDSIRKDDSDSGVYGMILRARTRMTQETG